MIWKRSVQYFYLLWSFFFLYIFVFRTLLVIYIIYLVPSPNIESLLSKSLLYLSHKLRLFRTNICSSRDPLVWLAFFCTWQLPRHWQPLTTIHPNILSFSVRISSSIFKDALCSHTHFRVYVRPFTWQPSNFPEIDKKLRLKGKKNVSHSNENPRGC